MDSLSLDSLQYILSFISLTQLMQLKLVSRWFCFCIRDMTVTHLPLAQVSADIQTKRKRRPIVIRYDRIFKQFNHLTVVDAEGLEVSMQLLIHYKHTLRKLSVGSLVMDKPEHASMTFERIQSISFTSLEAKDFALISRFPKIGEFRITKLDKDCSHLDQAFKLLPANLISLSCRVKCLRRLNRADFASTLQTLGLFCNETPNEVPNYQIMHLFAYYGTYGLKLPNLQNLTLHQVTANRFSQILLSSPVLRLRSLRVCPSSNRYPDLCYYTSLLPGLEEYHISFQNIRVDRMIWKVPENWMKIDPFMTTKVLIIDKGYMIDSALASLLQDRILVGQRFPSLTRLQLTDPENEFSPAAVIRFLKSTVAQKLTKIDISSMMEIAVTDATDLKVTVENLSLKNLRESEITFSSMQSSRSFIRVIPLKPTGTLLASGMEKNATTGLQVKSAYPLVTTLIPPGNLSDRGPSGIIRMLNSIRDFEVSPSLRKFIKSQNLNGWYFYGLPSNADRMAELIREGGLSRQEAGLLKRQVRVLGWVQGIWRAKDNTLIAVMLMCFLPLFVAHCSILMIIPILVYRSFPETTIWKNIVPFLFFPFGTFLALVSCAIGIYFARQIIVNHQRDKLALYTMLSVAWTALIVTFTAFLFYLTRDHCC